MDCVVPRIYVPDLAQQVGEVWEPSQMWIHVAPLESASARK
jgi:hypothetical protein